MLRTRSQQQILDALGERIAQLRHTAGLTQESLSLLSEIDIQAIQRAETGRSALSFERLERVADAQVVCEVVGDDDGPRVRPRLVVDPRSELERRRELRR